MKNLILILLAFWPIIGMGQVAVSVQTGTSLVYSEHTLRLEFYDLLAEKENHQLKFGFSGGVWKSNLFSENLGCVLTPGLVYLRGKSKHFFEMDAGLNIYLDKGTEPRNISYLGLLPDFFAGYRFQAIDNGLLFKAGLGTMSFFKFGIGYKF